MELNSTLTMTWIRVNIARRQLDLNSSLNRMATADSRLTRKLFNKNTFRSVQFLQNPLCHEPGWNLKHKLHGVLLDLIDAVF